MKHLKSILFIVGLGVVMAVYITFMWTWFTAYFNGYATLVIQKKCDGK